MPGKIDASLNEKLASVEWGEYRIGDLFTVIDTSRNLREGGDLPATTAIQTNNQIGKYVYRENATILKNVFSATANGFGKAFFQPNEFTVYQDSYAFELKDKTIKVNKIHPFIVTSLNKVYSKYNWANKSGWKKVKDEFIKLPVKNGKIDFNFMESFIADLEDQRIADLESYLSITGLKDYELTEKEEKVIQEFKQRKIMFDNFTIQSLFNHIKQGKRLKKDDQIKGNLPFVMSGVGNTGIVGYISNSVEVFPENSITIDIFGNVFYRNYLFGAGDDTGAYWNDNKCYSKKMMLFLASSISRALYGKYSYGKKLRSSQSKNIKITLPMKNNEPDFEFMELFISAIQKLVIKDVVNYADNKIYATKQVIDKK